MIVSAHQPSYLPWLGYFHKVSLCDKFVYFDHVAQSKKDFTTRNKIKTSQGEMWLTVPVSKEDSNRICDLAIDNTSSWKRVHIKSIKNCYSKTSHFEEYFPRLEELYSKKYENFSDMNFDLTNLLFEFLGMKVDMVRSSELEIEGSKNEGIFELMEKLDSDKLVFGQHGKDYVVKEEYAAKNIEYYFQDYKHPQYEQKFGEFLPYMSVLDLLFNCGANSLETINKNNVCKSELFV
jgi:hypothetical protein